MNHTAHQPVVNNQQTSEKFWMVVGEGPATVRHNSFEKAHAEAERLAKNYPGKKFFVTMAVESVVVGGLQVTKL